ncbi:hypothetical protein [Nocardioides caldifontis]|uniref:hypothetical protein n=1 Tax=Nocardioides caldifontis TaxID=2588938 RepID=UPI00193A2CD7|nr:hypothetical protein [Nocardioides caldifontis]
MGARHGDAGMLGYTDPVHVAVLKKQVLTTPGVEPFEKQVKQTVASLRAMRRLRLR